MKTLSHLFEKNKQWAESVLKQDPTFFERLSKQQKPRFLWIGCADSRVPATQICGLDPGEMFVHRNIANLVSRRDLNCLSVIEYAVNYLGVTDIIVCGHYGCGGVAGAMSQKSLGMIDYWIQDISEIYSQNAEMINSTCSTESEKVDKLCELNVAKQIKNLSALPVVQKAWARGHKLTIHGWVYGLKDGLLKDLGQTVSSMEDVQKYMDLNFE